MPSFLLLPISLDCIWLDGTETRFQWPKDKGLYLSSVKSLQIELVRLLQEIIRVRDRFSLLVLPSSHGHNLATPPAVMLLNYDHDPGRRTGDEPRT